MADRIKLIVICPYLQLVKRDLRAAFFRHRHRRHWRFIRHDMEKVIFGAKGFFRYRRTVSPCSDIFGRLLGVVDQSHQITPSTPILKHRLLRTLRQVRLPSRHGLFCIPQVRITLCIRNFLHLLIVFIFSQIHASTTAGIVLFFLLSIHIFRVIFFFLLRLIIAASISLHVIAKSSSAAFAT